MQLSCIYHLFSSAVIEVKSTCTPSTNFEIDLRIAIGQCADFDTFKSTASLLNDWFQSIVTILKYIAQGGACCWHIVARRHIRPRIVYSPGVQPPHEPSLGRLWYALTFRCNHQQHKGGNSLMHTPLVHGIIDRPRLVSVKPNGTVFYKALRYDPREMLPTLFQAQCTWGCGGCVF